jgi:hypothetical protein
VTQQQDDFLIGLALTAVPEQVTDALDRSLRGLHRPGILEIPRRQTRQDLFDRSHAHGQVEPIKDVAHRLSGRSAHQVR